MQGDSKRVEVLVAFILSTSSLGETTGTSSQ